MLNTARGLSAMEPQEEALIRRLIARLKAEGLSAEQIKIEEDKLTTEFSDPDLAVVASRY
jgi:hypothetical protein